MNPHDNDLHLVRDHHQDLLEEASRRRLAGRSRPRRQMYRLRSRRARRTED